MGKTKRLVALLCVLVLPLGAAGAFAEAENETLSLIAGTQAVKAFTEEAVPQEALDAVLSAGAQAPSARNTQPWRFTVVQNAELIEQLSQSANGTLILISGTTEPQEGVNVDFDCALATENMYLAALSLGLSGFISTGPVRSANEMKDTLEIPEGFEVVALLHIGYADVDALSSASVRNPLSDITNTVE